MLGGASFQSLAVFLYSFLGDTLRSISIVLLNFKRPIDKGLLEEKLRLISLFALELFKSFLS